MSLPFFSLHSYFFTNGAARQHLESSSSSSKLLVDLAALKNEQKSFLETTPKPGRQYHEHEQHQQRLPFARPLPQKSVHKSDAAQVRCCCCFKRSLWTAAIDCCCFSVSAVKARTGQQRRRRRLQQQWLPSGKSAPSGSKKSLKKWSKPRPKELLQAVMI